MDSLAELTPDAEPAEGDLNTNNNSNVVVAGGGGGGSVVVVQSNKQQSSCRAAIPAMHIAMAVICCIFNVIFPGLGKFDIFSLNCVFILYQIQLQVNWQRIDQGKVFSFRLQTNRGSFVVWTAGK